MPALQRPPATRHRTAALLAVALLAAPFAGSCRRAERTASHAPSEQEWRWLEQTRDRLAVMRREAAELRQQMQDAPPSRRRAGAAEQEAAAADLATREAAIAQLSSTYGTRLVEVVATLGPFTPGALTAPQQRAVRMKSDEDMAVAAEWIARGGDYRRAIEIYETQLQIDTDNERLRKALADAEEMRFVSAERFAQVKEGMTAGEVRAALGPVNLHNLMRQESRGVEAWAYPRQGGGVARVFLRRGDAGALVVYRTEWSAATEAPPPGEPAPSPPPASATGARTVG